MNSFRDVSGQPFLAREDEESDGENINDFFSASSTDCADRLKGTAVAVGTADYFY